MEDNRINIVDLLYKIFNEKTLPFWMSSIIVLIIILIYMVIKTVPKIIQDRIANKTEFGNTQKLQIESYFREVSGDRLVKVFSKWSDMLIDTAEFQKMISNPNGLNDLMRETILFGSDRTLTLVSDFQGYNYLNNNHSGDAPLEGRTVNEYTITVLCFSVCIISSLKKDFSGYEIDPLYLLKLKLTDFDSMRDIFKKNIDIIEGEFKGKNSFS